MEAMLRAVWQRLLPDAVWLLLNDSTSAAFFSRQDDFCASLEKIGNRPPAYVCPTFFCRMPATNGAAFRLKLGPAPTKGVCPGPKPPTTPPKIMTLFGIKLLGINEHNGQKLLFTLVLLAGVYLFRTLVRYVVPIVVRGSSRETVIFWIRQGVSLFCAVVVVLGLASVWFDNPARLTTAAGLVTAGLAFALQNLVISFAGYFVILRGKNFSIGDRITMGGVRGDVIALGFIQTTIMEMGQPPAVQSADPAVWVASRQYTGRVVTVANGEIFKSPVFNYTRDFPFIWEEMMIPISFKDDRKQAEEILIAAAAEHAVKTNDVRPAVLHLMQKRYFIDLADFSPKVYYRITDNWLELTVRFLSHAHGVRDVKDAMSRHILPALQAANIGIASSTYDIVGFPPIRIERAPRTNR
jgi:small-conductance mechanosensitive channel